MSEPERRRIDLGNLPPWARYAIALAVLATVVAVVLLVPGGRATAGPAEWYTAVVRVGAVVLLVYVGAWLVRRLITRHRRH